MTTDNTDNAIWGLVDLTLIVLASSTIAYEVILFTGSPLWGCYPLFVVVLGTLLLAWTKLSGFRPPYRWNIELLSLLVLSICCAMLNVFVLRPDPDDFTFFHRAVYGLMDLEAPIPRFHTAHDVKALPPISPVHLTTSIEVMSSLFAHAVGLNPLFFYQMASGAFFLSLFPLIYYLFFRYLGFSYMQSYLGCVILIVLYAFSGDSHQDFGNFTLVRAWQGKCILMLLVVPLVSLLTFRVLQDFSIRDTCRLQLAAITGLGLSGSAFFLVPFTVGAGFIGVAISRWREPEFLRRSVCLLTVIISFAIVVALIKLGLVPQVNNVDVWRGESILGVNDDLPLEIFVLDRTIFLKKTTLLFYGISIICLIFFYRQNKKITALCISSVLVSVSLVTPPASVILINIVLPMAYWRLAYAIHMLLLVAIFVLMLVFEVNSASRVQVVLKRIFAITILGSFIAFKTPAINPSVISGAHIFKFDESIIELVDALQGINLQGNSALAPEEVVSVLGLLHPELPFVSIGKLETLHVFVNADMKEDAEKRIAAQQDLGGCGKNGKLMLLLSQIKNIGLIVFPATCTQKDIEANLGIHPQDWTVIATSRYQAWKKNG